MQTGEKDQQKDTRIGACARETCVLHASKSVDIARNSPSTSNLLEVLHDGVEEDVDIWSTHTMTSNAILK